MTAKRRLKIASKVFLLTDMAGTWLTIFLIKKIVIVLANEDQPNYQGFFHSNFGNKNDTIEEILEMK